jgi:hypothetical protein
MAGCVRVDLFEGRAAKKGEEAVLFGRMGGTELLGDRRIIENGDAETAMTKQIRHGVDTIPNE